MNEMETLYEEFRALRREVQEKDYDEVGAFELREYRRRFERLHTRNLELQSKSRRSEDVDDEELRQILDLGDRMWFELGEALKPIVQVIDIKMALGKQMAEERDHIRTTNADYVSIINSLKKRLKANKKRFESVTAPEAKEILDQNIKDDEETIRHLEELVEKNNTRFKELGEKIRILIVKGGRLPEVEDTKEDTEGLDPEEVTEKTKKIEEETEEPIPGLADEPTEPEEPVSGLADEPAAEGEGLPGVSFGDIDPITPVAGTDEPTEPEEPVPGLADEPTAEGEGLPGVSFDDIDPITPVAGTDEPTEPEESVPELPDEPTEPEESVPELPDEPTEPEESVPELPDEPTESEEPIPELPEEPEEELPVRASVKQPRTRLWQRVPTILQAAAVFLLTAIAAHTGYIARSTNKPAEKTSTDIVEETTTPVVTPTATPAPSAEPAETPTATPAPSAEPAETPTATPAPSVEPTAATPAPTATPAPAANPTPTATSTPTSTAEPTVTPTVNENNIILDQGESVYNSETGVEVGYTGIAGLETKDGYVPQENRDLEKGQDGTVIVTKSDLKPDTIVSALPRTGKEVSEETAKKNMTVEEKDNLEEATKEVDWESFFNDGPMLQ